MGRFVTHLMPGLLLCGGRIICAVIAASTHAGIVLAANILLGTYFCNFLLRTIQPILFHERSVTSIRRRGHMRLGLGCRHRRINTKEKWWMIFHTPLLIAASAAAADSSEASANFVSNGAEWAECTDATVLMMGYCYECRSRQDCRYQQHRQVRSWHYSWKYYSSIND